MFYELLSKLKKDKDIRSVIKTLKELDKLRKEFKAYSKKLLETEYSKSLSEWEKILSPEDWKKAKGISFQEKYDNYHAHRRYGYCNEYIFCYKRKKLIPLYVGNAPTTGEYYGYTKKYEISEDGCILFIIIKFSWSNMRGVSRRTNYGTSIYAINLIEKSAYVVDKKDGSTDVKGVTFELKDYIDYED